MGQNQLQSDRMLNILTELAKTAKINRIWPTDPEPSLVNLGQAR